MAKEQRSLITATTDVFRGMREFGPKNTLTLLLGIPILGAGLGAVSGGITEEAVEGIHSLSGGMGFDVPPSLRIPLLLGFASCGFIISETSAIGTLSSVGQERRQRISRKRFSSSMNS